MKKRFCLLIAILLTLQLAGCATDDAIPEMSEDELQMVEEYAAQLLLRHDANYKAATISEEQLREERERIERLAAVQLKIAEERAAMEAEAAEKEAGKGSESGGEAGPETSAPLYTDIDEFFGLSGVDIDYVRYIVCDSYPTETEENDWQGVVNATAGNRLLVFEYNIRNRSDAPVMLDLASLSPRFTFRINQSFSKAAMLTMLMNDLALYRGEIAANENATAVLVIELTAAQAEDVRSLTMIMRSGDARGELTLK